MRYICTTTCFDSANVRKFEADTVYDFSKDDVARLKKIDQLRRFEPLDRTAREEAKKPEALEPSSGSEA